MSQRLSLVLLTKDTAKTADPFRDTMVFTHEVMDE